MNVSLVLIQNDGTIREAILKPGSSVIGRQVGCSIRIPAAEVSRQHCEVLFKGDVLTLRDLGSANGTLVNGTRIEQCEVKAGDLITIGSINLLVRVDGKPARVDPRLTKAASGKANAASGSRVSPAARPPQSKPPATPGGKPSVLEELGIDPSKLQNEDSSIADFNFDFEDDDDQPKL
ncbi:MAG: FHA domain-containing protein [Phycisphaeraceae bacterium]|nr:FHA domain-containing protein [Phycisphaeraceae bacterium]